MSWIYFDGKWINLAAACLIEDRGDNGYRIVFPGETLPVKIDPTAWCLRISETVLAVKAVQALTANRVNISFRQAIDGT